MTAPARRYGAMGNSAVREPSSAMRDPSASEIALPLRSMTIVPRAAETVIRVASARTYGSSGATTTPETSSAGVEPVTSAPLTMMPTTTGFTLRCTA